VIDELKRRLAVAKQRSARGRQAIARQQALILDLEKAQHETSVAERVLSTMTETQHLYEEAERELIDELRLVAPEEFAEVAKRPPANEGNKLLSTLLLSDFLLMQPHLKPIDLRFRHRFQMANRIMKTVHFPDSGIISVATNGGRHQAQIGLIGREGMTGVSIVFGSQYSPFDLQVEVEGQAQSIDTETLTALMYRSPSIRTALIEYLRSLWLQFADTAAANANGTIEQRLARLLLLVGEKLVSDEIHLTHEQLATMLSVRRAGVTVTLHDLNASGLISLRRASIQINDHVGLQSVARSMH